MTTPTNPVIVNIYVTNNGVDESDSVNILNMPTAKIKKLQTSTIIVRVVFFILIDLPLVNNPQPNVNTYIYRLT